jgi:hypothetical protein
MITTTYRSRIEFSSAVGAPLLRAIDAVETDAFSAVVVQSFDSVAVEDRDNGAGEVDSCEGSTQEK